MKSSELLNQIFGIKGLVSARELNLYQVKLRLDNKVLPYTGCSEDAIRNRVFFYSNRGRKDVNLMGLLLRLKRFNLCRELKLTYGYNLYSVVSVHINPVDYIFTINVR